MQGILNGYSLAHQMKSEQLQQQQYAQSVQRDADAKSARDLQSQMALRAQGYKPSTPAQDVEALTGQGYVNGPAPAGGGPGLAAQMTAAAPAPQPQQPDLPAAGPSAANKWTPQVPTPQLQQGPDAGFTPPTGASAMPAPQILQTGPSDIKSRMVKWGGQNWVQPSQGELDARAAKASAADTAGQLALYQGKKAIDVGAMKQEGKDKYDQYSVGFTNDGKNLAPGTRLMQGPTFGNGLTEALKAANTPAGAADPVHSTHISYDDKGNGTATSITKSGKVLDPVPLGTIGKSAKPAKDPNAITPYQQAQLDRQTKAADEKKMKDHVDGITKANGSIAALEKTKDPILKENDLLTRRAIALGKGLDVDPKGKTFKPPTAYTPEARDALIGQIKGKIADNATRYKGIVDQQHGIATGWANGGAAPVNPYAPKPVNPYAPQPAQ